MKVAMLVTLLTLVGCTTARPPTDVTIIPNDCANNTAITNWLVAQSKQPRSMFENEELYYEHKRSIKNRLWNFRYNCNAL